MPNPENLKPFQPGQSGNPGGKTSEHRRLEIEAAEMAARLRHRMLVALDSQMDVNDMPAVLDAIKSDVLRLIKDSEDRAHGTPKQSIESSGPDGAAIPVAFNINIRGVENADR